MWFKWFLLVFLVPLSLLMLIGCGTHKKPIQYETAGEQQKRFVEQNRPWSFQYVK
jgi:hypothetical protein